MNIGTLTIEMAANIARLQADMNQAKTVVNESMQSIQQAVDLAKKAFIAFAGIATVDAFAGMVRGAIDSAAAMGKLATQAGVTVEAMSGLASVGKLSGTSSDQVAGAMQKMSMAMSGANEDAKGAAAALRALGINFDDFNKMTPDQRMMAVAKSMDGFADGAGKSAAAMLLMGKSGADLLPYMKDLAQVGDLQAKVTTEQSARAKDFELNLNKVKATSEAWKKEVAMGMLPALDDVSKAYVQVMNGQDGVRASITELARDGTLSDWVRTAVTGISYVVDVGQGLLTLIPIIGKAIGAIAAGAVEGFSSIADAAKRVAAGDFGGAISALKAGWSSVKTIGVEAGNDIANIWGTQLLGQKFRDRLDDISKVQQALKETKPALDANLNQAIKGGSDKLSEYDKLIEKIKEKTAASNAELTQDTQLTEGQKMAILVMEQLRTGKLKLTQAQAQAVSAALSEMLVSEQLSKEHANQVKATEAANEAHIKYIQSLSDGVEKLQKQIAAQKQANEELGLNKDAIGELRAAQLELEADRVSMLAFKQYERDLDLAEYNLLLQQAAAMRELAQLKREGGMKEAALAEAKAAQEAWKQVTDQIDKAGTNALMNMFEQGTSFAKAFRDTLASMFKTLILRPVISFILNPVSGAIGQMLGINVGGAASGASALSSFGGLGGIGSTVGAFTGTMATGAMNTIFGTGMGAGLDAAGAMIANGATASGLGMGVGAVAPYALAAVAAYNVLSSLNGGETRSGGQYGVAYDGKVTNNRRGETYTRVGQQYNRDAGNQTAVTNGQAYLMEADGLGSNDSAVRNAIAATAATIQGTLKDLGSSMTLNGFFAGLETSGNGRGGVMAGGSFANGVAFGSTGKGSNYDGTLYDTAFTRSPDMQTALANLTTDLKQTTIQALQAANDIPQTIKDMLKDVNAKALSDTAAGALITQIQTQITNVKYLQQAFATLQIKTLGDVTFDAASKIISALGGIDAATSKLSSYYQNYYTDAERTATQTKNLQDAFKALGLDMPTTREAFRKLMEAQDLNTSSGQAMYASLLKLADAFAALVPATNSATQATNNQTQAAQNATQAAQAAADKLAAAKSAASAAYDALGRAVQVQLDAAHASEASANAQISAVNSVMGVLRSNIQGLLSQTAASLTAKQGRDFIAAALASGKLPDATALGDAISAARSGMVDGNYSSQYEADRDRRVLVGQLQALQDAAGVQLTDAQRQLQAAQDQIRRLDDLLKAAKAQLDALNGIDTSIQDVNTALSAFTDALKTALGLQKGNGSTASGGGSGSGASDPFTVGGVAPGTDAKPSGSGASTTGGIALLVPPSAFTVGGVATGGAAASSTPGAATYGGLPLLVPNQKKDIPAYANGGLHSGGWALVGEDGPELAYFDNPAKIYTASQTQALRNASSDTSSDNNAERRAEATAQASLTARMVRLLERWEANGMPQTRAVT